MHTLPKNTLQDNTFTVDPTVQEFTYLDNVSEDYNDDDDSAYDDKNDDDSDEDDSDDDCLVVNLGEGTSTNGFSFWNHCKLTCLSCDFPKNCCGKTRDIAFTSIRDYFIFPSSTIHCGYFSKDPNKIFVIAQLFCVCSSSADMGQVNQPVMTKHSEIEFNCLGTSDALTNLSNTGLNCWDEDYPLNQFSPPKQYKNEPIVIRMSTVKYRRNNFHK
jgi:hypothetical protein